MKNLFPPAVIPSHLKFPESHSSTPSSYRNWSSICMARISEKLSCTGYRAEIDDVSLASSRRHPLPYEQIVNLISKIYINSIITYWSRILLCDLFIISEDLFLVNRNNWVAGILQFPDQQVRPGLPVNLPNVLWCQSKHRNKEHYKLCQGSVFMMANHWNIECSINNQPVKAAVTGL